MKLVVTGSTGMLGSMVVWYARSTGWDVTTVPRSVDAKTATVHTLLEYVHPGDCVINCLGAIPQKHYTDADMYQINSVFPHTLASACALIGASLIHISTNCVFSGTRPNYSVEDTPDAKDVYGRSKALGEPMNALVVRCSIIGLEQSTSYGLLEWYLHRSSSVEGYKNVFWNGVTTLELAQFILEEAKKEITSRVIHLASAETVSKYDILACAKKVWGKCGHVIPVYVTEKHYTLKGTHIVVSSIQEKLQSLKYIKTIPL
jgi:dTDP-4-dehydrorhamnose reductase